MTITRISKQYLEKIEKGNALRSSVSDYLKRHSNLSEDEQKVFVECYIQENTIETTAFKLNKNVRDISFLYFGISTDLVHKALVAVL